MRAEVRYLVFTTKDRWTFFDLTDQIREELKKTGYQNGQVLVYSMHTTCAVLINENERGFTNDLRRVAESIAAFEDYYEHDDFELRTQNLLRDESGKITERKNGHSHIYQALVGKTSETVPFADGELLLGRWQSVLLVELDQADEPLTRKVCLHIVGF